MKPIHQIIDETPIVNEHQLSFWDWMSNYYMCGIGEVMKASIPSVLLIESETIISLNKNTEFIQNELTDDEFLIYEALLNATELSIQEISEILNKLGIKDQQHGCSNGSEWFGSDSKISSFSPVDLSLIHI